ncbi:MAG: hypothetical protein R3266_04680, partial [Gemmatimonadota bacterium]|nr:hypothetical protein [Gemmatimonadota bacterium]
MTNVTLSGGSGPVSDICGTVTDPTNGLPGIQIASPCDGDFANSDGAFPDIPGSSPDPDKLPFTGSTWWLSSLDRSPNPTPANFGGLASRLQVRAYPYPDEAACKTAAGDPNFDCSVRQLGPVTEVFDATTGTSLRYVTSWKSKKDKKGGPGAGDFVPNNSYWQIVLFLDFDGKNGFESTEDIASRVIKWTDTPSSDQPLDGWSLDINWGSNQPIPFVLEDDGQCFGQARDLDDGSPDGEVRCLVNGNNGATLIVDFGNGEGAGIELGPNNEFGLAVVTGEVCTDATGN